MRSTDYDETTGSGVMATHGARPIRTRWVGWVYFAGIVMLGIGIIQIVSGFLALARSGATYVAPSGMTVQVSFASVGWSFLITGLVVAAAGVGVLNGRTWARVVGVLLVLVSLVTNILFFTAYPLWSAIVVVLDVVVIYALTAHGREAQRSP